MPLPKPPAGSSQFSKLQDGVNKFRFLTDVVFGWEGWKDKKPFRHEGLECKIKPEQVDKNMNGDPAISFFWAAVVWNYKEKKVQVLELTQKTIMRVLYEYEQKEEFGDIKGYDVEITRSKEGDKTTYTTIALPPKKLAKEIAEEYEKTEVKLEKLFEGKYPMGDEINPEDSPF
jgi:hypothetical protein